MMLKDVRIARNRNFSETLTLERQGLNDNEYEENVILTETGHLTHNQYQYKSSTLAQISDQNDFDHQFVYCSHLSSIFVQPNRKNGICDEIV